MNDHLTRLRVPSQVQNFFAVKEPIFDFGGQVEVFSDTAHIVPATNNLWIAGNQYARQVIITFSAMEAIAFLSLNLLTYPDFDNLLFIAIGSRLSKGQLDWISQNLKHREFTLSFGNDLIGRLTDIKFAAAIRRKIVRLSFEKGNVIARLKEKTIQFEEDKVSLHAFETAFGIRTKIRTRKPLNQLTFLDQLKYDTSR